MKQLWTDLEKTDEVGMFEQLYDADLAREELVEVLGGCVTLGDDLDGNVRLVPVGVGQLDGGVRATAQLPHHLVAVFLEDRVTRIVFRCRHHLRTGRLKPEHKNSILYRGWSRPD